MSGEATTIEGVLKTRQLAEEAQARGLESQMVSLLRRNRQRAIKSILSTQEKSRWQESDYEVASSCLKAMAQPNSEFAIQFAKKMAHCDEIYVHHLAKRCRWTTSEVAGAPSSPRSTLHDLAPRVPRRYQSSSKVVES